MKYLHDICIVGLRSLDYLTNEPFPKYMGGIERQLPTLARCLTDDGVRVAFITYDHGQDRFIRVGGVDIYASYEPNEGIRRIRFLHPRTTRLVSAMRLARSRLYLQMGASALTGQVSLGTRLVGNKARFVFLTGSDGDCSSSLQSLKSKWARVFYKWGLKRAHCVVVQTSSQAHSLEHNFGVTPTILRLPCVPPNPIEPTTSDPGEEIRVLWVGRIHPDKRPDKLMELAARCTDVHFDVIGDAGDDTEYGQRFLREAGRHPNIVVHGKVGDSELSEFYETASFLCCTSDVEGFPTTFLEAWAYGVPVITSFDPDGVVAGHGLGRVAVTIEEMAFAIRNGLNPGNRDCWSRNARTFYLENFSPSSCVPRIRAVLEKVVESRTAQRRS